MPPKGPKKPPLTHFLCIPLVTTYSRPFLEGALSGFKSDFATARAADIGAKYNARGDTAASTAAWQQAVRPVGTLHLTLGVMSLREQGKLEAAMALLRELDIGKLLLEARDAAGVSGINHQGSAKSTPVAPTTEQSSPLQITLRALHPMQSAKSTTTLYAAPYDDTNRLRPVCERLKGIFTQKGFMLAEDRPLKLHATIVNTIYAKLEKLSAGTDSQLDDVDPLNEGKTFRDGKEAPDEQQTGEPRVANEAVGKQRYDKPRSRGKHPPVSFDARELIQQYKDFEWATSIVPDRIAICEMGAKKILDEAGNIVEEAYHEVAVRQLPT